MKPQSKEATMFPPQRYATAAINREIPLAVQLFLWQCTCLFLDKSEYIDNILTTN